MSLACALSTPEFRARRDTVIAEIRSLVVKVEETADGYIFTMPASEGTITQVAYFIATERQCCEFFSFRLVVLSDTAQLSLEISGPAGAKEFLRDEMGLPGGNPGPVR